MFIQPRRGFVERKFAAGKGDGCPDSRYAVDKDSHLARDRLGVVEDFCEGVDRAGWNGVILARLQEIGT